MVGASVPLYEKTINIIKNKGIKVFFNKCLMKVYRIFFQTNNALWFKKDLRESSLDIDVDIPIKLIFTKIDRLINWLEAKKSNFPWIYVEKEIRIARSANHIYPFIVHKDKIIGYIKIGLNMVYIQDFDETVPLPPRDAFIYDTFVLPEYRGKHIAAFLVQEVSEYLRRAGYERVWCHIPPWNTASIKVYQRVGFQEIACIKFMRLMWWKFFNLDPEEMIQKESALWT